MKKVLLAIALSVTASNLVIGVTYAAICQGSKGARACGNTCVATAGGGCECTGSCSAEERRWVAGDRELVAEVEEGNVD